MSETNVPRAPAVTDVVEVLHTLANLITVRGHYPEEHPAIARVDAAAATSFNSFLVRTQELVLALIEGEFVVNERPMPGLYRQLGPLAEAMLRHEIECLVFQRGMLPAECSILGRTLKLPPSDNPAQLRAELQAGLSHVLLRFAALKRSDASGREGPPAEYLVPTVQQLHQSIVEAMVKERLVDLVAVRGVASKFVTACHSRSFVIQARAFTRGVLDEASHATNVAWMACAMALDAGYPDDVCIEVVAAALMHDIGILLLPERIRGIPAPLLDERERAVFRQHSSVGSAALLGAGCPPLWVAAAMDHHRGVDGGGYPPEQEGTPHELVRMIALASFFDRKRTIAAGACDEPEQALRRAAELEDRYFGRGLVSRFLHALGVYPPGTTVELSDGTVAIVTHANGNDPLRPQVRRLFGAEAGRRIDLKDLDAVEDRHPVSIVRAVAPPLVAPEGPIIVAPSIRPAPATLPPPSAKPRALTPPPRTLTQPPRARTLPPIPREDPEEVPTRSITPRRIVATAAVALSDEALLARVPKLRVGAADVKSLGLDHFAGFMLTFVDGATRVEDLVDISGLPRAEALYVIRMLLDKGVLSID